MKHLLRFLSYSIVMATSLISYEITDVEKRHDVILYALAVGSFLGIQAIISHLFDTKEEKQ